ncbi:seryl-tRNA synthetase [Candidatus Hydrogenisulfobacillus filiaventi]|uniref:Serine--tRNA ligase n=1 Tax=Candidatus Hydrogenisulfobacillus filiaventi TaxID=2707344 RepID=A0A6F8ZD30_9FIRM|nr:serine--tRNA ligase [Bacillota bacterium]CAB1127517.1 seryl-tRNA synthetase [Candidatus Hydrogenisulfobacillus filiaventi]
MLDLRRIRQDPETVARLLAKKHVAVDLEAVLELDRRARAIRRELEELQARRNRGSEAVARLKREQRDAEELIRQVRADGERIDALEAELEPLEAELRARLLEIPNVPDPDVPEGEDAGSNVEVRRWGEPPSFAFAARPHWDLGEALGIMDFERAHKISGSRFSVLAGDGARLSRALINFMLDHAREAGYREMAVPYLVNRDSMIGTGQFPKFEEDVYRVVPHEYYLISTAEIPLTNLHREEILEEAELPIKLVGYTACFRAEAGAAGRDTRGLIRQHQFDKVELVQLVRPEASPAALEEMVTTAQGVLEALGLPYRTVLLCGGDMGFGQARTYDLEVWMPSYGRYVEISSCSNMTDFQARRAGIRYRPQGSKRTEYVHTLNGSALAVGRTLAALVENLQTEDGQVRVPEVLVPYLGGQTLVGRP